MFSHLQVVQDVKYGVEITFSAGANIIFLLIITITITVVRLWHALVAYLFLLLQHSEQIVRAELEKERERDIEES